MSTLKNCNKCTNGTYCTCCRDGVTAGSADCSYKLDTTWWPSYVREHLTAEEIEFARDQLSSEID